MLDIILMICASTVGYASMWGLTIGVRQRLMYRTETEGDIFLAGMWPIYLPVLLAWKAVENFEVRQLRLPKLKRASKPKPTEIAPGIPCSIQVMVGMVKASLLRDAKVGTYHLKNDKVVVHFTALHRAVESIKIGTIFYSSEDLPTACHEELIELFHLLKKQDEEKQRAAIEAERQHRAIDGIEALLEPVVS